MARRALEVREETKRYSLLLGKGAGEEVDLCGVGEGFPKEWWKVVDVQVAEMATRAPEIS